MDHDQFKQIYRKLGDMGVMIPMRELADCALTGRDVLASKAGRYWQQMTPIRKQCASAYRIHLINQELTDLFKHCRPAIGCEYTVASYLDGAMVLEVKRVINWTTLNHFESSLRGGFRYVRR